MRVFDVGFDRLNQYMEGEVPCWAFMVFFGKSSSGEEGCFEVVGC